MTRSQIWSPTSSSVRAPPARVPQRHGVQGGEQGVADDAGVGGAEGTLGDAVGQDRLQAGHVGPQRRPDGLVLDVRQRHPGGDPPGRVGEEAAEMAEAEGPQALLGRHALPGQGRHRLLLGGQDVGDDVAEQLLLALHVVVEAGLGQADPVADGVERGPLQTHLGDHLGRRPHDQVPAGLPAPFPPLLREGRAGRHAPRLRLGRGQAENQRMRRSPSVRPAPVPSSVASRRWAPRRRSAGGRPRGGPAGRRRAAARVWVVVPSVHGGRTWSSGMPTSAGCRSMPGQRTGIASTGGPDPASSIEAACARSSSRGYERAPTTQVPHCDVTRPTTAMIRPTGFGQSGTGSSRPRGRAGDRPVSVDHRSGHVDIDHPRRPPGRSGPTISRRRLMVGTWQSMRSVRQASNASSSNRSPGVPLPEVAATGSPPRRPTLADHPAEGHADHDPAGATDRPPPGCGRPPQPRSTTVAPPEPAGQQPTGRPTSGRPTRSSSADNGTRDPPAARRSREHRRCSSRGMRGLLPGRARALVRGDRYRCARQIRLDVVFQRRLRLEDSTGAGWV